MSSGELQMPHFQRFGVWKRSQRLELFRSIAEGVPMGAILLWRTRKSDITTVNEIGLHHLPAPSKAKGATRNYLLDGVQRLSTLYTALFPPDSDGPTDDGETAEDLTVFYDLRAQTFVVQSELADGVKPHHLPLTVINDSIRLIRFQRGLKDDDADTLTERADSIAQAFRQYKVAVLPIFSDDLAHATKTFQRVNSQGTPMSEVHMVNALVYGPDYHLLDRISEAIRETLAPEGWGKLSEETFLRTIKAILGIDVYDTKPEETHAGILKRHSIVDEAATALSRVARLLRSELDIRSPILVPYNAQIVLLASTLHEIPTPKKVGRQALKDWLELSTYSELFASSMSASRFGIIAKELAEGATGKGLVWSPRRPLARRDLPAQFDFRHARGRLLALRLASAAATDPDRPSDPLDALARDGNEAVPQIFTARHVGSTGDWGRSPGARFSVADENVTALRDRLLQSNASEEFLRSHLLTSESHKLFLKQRWEAAILERARHLDALEATDFQRLVERHGGGRSLAGAKKKTVRQVPNDPTRLGSARKTR
jgi:hypothetical protein